MQARPVSIPNAQIIDFVSQAISRRYSTDDTSINLWAFVSMAVFSAPFPTPDDAIKAVHAAIEQQAVIARLCSVWEEQGKRSFTVGMGINTGKVFMGNLGASSRMNYTVIGDNVNVVARLSNVAKEGIIICETTVEEVRNLVRTVEMDPVSVKGKSEPLRVYKVAALQ